MNAVQRLLSGAVKILRSHLDSERFFWRALVEAAYIANQFCFALLFPVYLLQNIGDTAKIRKMKLRKNDGSLLAFEMETKFFFANYEPLYDELKTKHRVYFIIPDFRRADLKEYLLSKGVPEDRILGSSWAFFVPWDLYMNCWIPYYFPSVLDRRSSTTKVQMFHGIGTAILRKHHHLAFNDKRRRKIRQFNVQFMIGPSYKRLQDSHPQIRWCKIGYPKLDRLFNGTSDLSVRKEFALKEGRPTIVYAPHHNAMLSLHTYGLGVVEALLRLDANVIVKLHHEILFPGHPLHWVRDALQTMQQNNDRLFLAKEEDSTLYYPLADAVVTDVGTSAAFEAVICGKPTVLLYNEHWFEKYGKDNPEFEILALCESVHALDQLPEAMERSLSLPQEEVARRRHKAEKWYYNPGTATQAAVAEIEQLLEERRKNDK